MGISCLNSICQALCAFNHGVNLLFIVAIQCCIPSNNMSHAAILEQRTSCIDPVTTRCFSTSKCNVFCTMSSKANLFWKSISLNAVRMVRITKLRTATIWKWCQKLTTAGHNLFLWAQRCAFLETNSPACDSLYWCGSFDKLETAYLPVCKSKRQCTSHTEPFSSWTDWRSICPKKCGWQQKFKH